MEEYENNGFLGVGKKQIVSSGWETGNLFGVSYN